MSYSRVSIERFLTHAIEVNDFYGSPNPACAGRNASAAPHIADIKYAGVVASADRQWWRDPAAHPAASFEGLADQHITGVHLEDVVLPGNSTAAAWDCRNVSGASGRGVHPAPCRALS